ncbi:hypothetical protein [Aequorivita sp. CIP111184]|uniref:hypothetical protein n=1 Tax=Aequorivita sp. CIP111184 TaxID=2211356 RepID=UPI000DBBC0F8|nr:hypothetical protein [Aequorivita sp. CIP111184]SRX55541.1 hypothetical protein AEQU1_02563 [Aequorivita sp. CIP111184]
MSLLKNFAEKNNGTYTEESIKEAFSPIGKLIYQPKSAYFMIGESKISVNLNEVGGAIPTAEPFRITLHLQNKNKNTLEIYPVSFWEIIFQNVFPSNQILIKGSYIFKGNKKLIDKLSTAGSIVSELKKQRVYIRIPKENTSKIILTPARGIETETEFEYFIAILKALEEKINSHND